jgi:hypothetical protein
MGKQIDEVNNCTGTSTIHDRLMTIIAQSDSRNRETGSMMEVTAVDVDEGQQNSCGDAYQFPFLTQTQVFGNQIMGIIINKS